MKDIETDDDEASTDTVCGDANVYEPFMTGLNDMFKPPDPFPALKGEGSPRSQALHPFTGATPL